ncbi:hypothetical protein BYT27DRAFT_7259456 [Phlegmacium glaucopus]|nr:hypothetical protein BYT27DRAFT_7259456 [Phlegmacium glaucopus]
MPPHRGKKPATTLPAASPPQPSRTHKCGPSNTDDNSSKPSTKKAQGNNEGTNPKRTRKPRKTSSIKAAEAASKAPPANVLKGASVASLKHPRAPDAKHMPPPPYHSSNEDNTSEKHDNKDNNNKVKDTSNKNNDDEDNAVKDNKDDVAEDEDNTVEIASNDNATDSNKIEQGTRADAHKDQTDEIEDAGSDTGSDEIEDTGNDTRSDNNSPVISIIPPVSPIVLVVKVSTPPMNPVLDQGSLISLSSFLSKLFILVPTLPMNPVLDQVSTPSMKPVPDQGRAYGNVLNHADFNYEDDEHTLVKPQLTFKIYIYVETGDVLALNKVPNFTLQLPVSVFILSGSSLLAKPVLEKATQLHASIIVNEIHHQIDHLRKERPWADSTPTKAEIINLFVAKTTWHSSYATSISAAKKHEEMRAWLAEEVGCVSEEELWDEAKDNYTMKDLEDWLEKKDGKKVKVVKKGKAKDIVKGKEQADISMEGKVTEKGKQKKEVTKSQNKKKSTG